MNYKIVKLCFLNGVHLGSGKLTDSEPVLMADTIFSALCHEVMKSGGTPVELYQACVNGELRISDAMPYIGEDLYLPKPLLRVEKDTQSDSIKKKAFKKLKYVPVSRFERYLNGQLDVIKEAEKLKQIGRYELRTNVALPRDGQSDSEPYHVGVFHFNTGSGLYLCVGTSDVEKESYYLQLIEALGYSGIGGRRSSGFGRFTIEVQGCPAEILRRLNNDSYKEYMSLSLSLPDEQELEKVMDGAKYKLVKRSGFVSSSVYADDFLKKRDFYSFAAGTVVQEKYKGSIQDVSNYGKHPVYQYALPMFLGVTK